MNKKNLFSKTIQKLMKEASRDGIISNDEFEIIEQVKVDADSYQVILTEALDDGMISEEEDVRLRELRSLIQERAKTIAHLDGKITVEEEALLAKLSKLIKTYYKTI